LIETDQQRRWWFATHPEYSHRSSCRSGAKDDKSEKLDPEKVDDWADGRLKHEKDPVARELLKQAKFWFGTEFASKPPGQQYALLGEENPVGSDSLFGEKSSDPPPPPGFLPKKEGRQLMEKVIREDINPLTPTGLLNRLPALRGLKFREAAKEILKALLKRAGRDVVVPVVKKGGGKAKGGGRGNGSYNREGSQKRSARLPPEGSEERKAIEAARDRGIRAKRREELAEIQAGGKGSGVWTKRELEEIRRTKKFPNDTV
jgi:hypothetical protein